MRTRALRGVPWLALLVGSGLPPSTSVALTVVAFHYSPDSIANVQGRVTYGGFPTHQTMLHVYDLGNAADSVIDWPIQDFTGAIVPTAAMPTAQRGIDPDSYGSTAFSMCGTQTGFQLNSRFTGAGYPVGPYYIGGSHVAYSFDDQEVRPWYTYGTTARLRLQHNMTIHHFSSTKSDCAAYYPVLSRSIFARRHL